MIIHYLNFVRYSKIEEIYGWEKLDQVLETTAAAVHDFLESRSLGTTRMMVGFPNDDDFIFLQIPDKGQPMPTDAQITEAGRQLQHFVGNRLEEVHGEDVSSLFDIFIGSSHVYYTPKIRFERLIYRGVREAANAARSVEQRERVRRTAALKGVLHEGSVYIDFHPIVLAETGEIFGYEALARGMPRNLRSPEVMFEVAAEADLVWELSRLCRARALAGAKELLKGEQLLFLNVDPHDFADPGIRRARLDRPAAHGPRDHGAHRDQGLSEVPRAAASAFRERGFRFAVDDAGSGYAGLGSIANLEPDFIKLDISLINSHRHELHQAESRRDNGGIRDGAGRDGDRGGDRARRGAGDGEADRRAAACRAFSCIGQRARRRGARARGRATACARLSRRSAPEQSMTDDARSRGRAQALSHHGACARARAPRALASREQRLEPRRELARTSLTEAPRVRGDEQARVAAPLVPRSEQHGHAERRRLEHRVESRARESRRPRTRHWRARRDRRAVRRGRRESHPHRLRRGARSPARA